MNIKRIKNEISSYTKDDILLLENYVRSTKMLKLKKCEILEIINDEKKKRGMQINEKKYFITLFGNTYVATARWFVIKKCSTVIFISNNCIDYILCNYSIFVCKWSIKKKGGQYASCRNNL